jgi:hypothetical protein
MGQERPAEPTALRARLTERILGLVERAIGRGEALPPSEWHSLRALASGNRQGLELVSRLESVVRECEQEIESRRRGGASNGELSELRAGIVEYVRQTVAPGASPKSD